MLSIYKSLIRPHLEYAVQCWAPSPRFGNWGIILELEKVQRKFTRLIIIIIIKSLHDYNVHIE